MLEMFGSVLSKYSFRETSKMLSFSLFVKSQADRSMETKTAALPPMCLVHVCLSLGAAKL